MTTENIVFCFNNKTEEAKDVSATTRLSKATTRSLGLKSPQKEPEGSYAYRLLQSAPKMPVEECEVTTETSVEIILMWGTNVLSVHTLTPPRSFYIGSEVPKTLEKSMLLVPAKVLGDAPVAIVHWDGSRVFAVIPAGCDGTIDVTQTENAPARLALLGGRVAPRAEGGAQRIALEKGSRVAIEVGDFTVRISVGNAARKLTAPFFGQESRAVAAYMLGTFATIAGCLVAMWLGGEPLAFSQETELDKTTTAVLLQATRKTREMEMSEQESVPQNSADQAKPTDSGAAHRGDAGMAGDPSKAMTGNYYQIKGPPDNPVVSLAKTRAAIENNSYGAIGAINMVFGSDAAMTAFDSTADETLGRDKAHAMGNVTGKFPGDSFGYEGLDSSGTSAGGGGWKDGIGLNNVGGFGHDRCIGGNCGTGYAMGISRNPPQHKAHTPSVLDREAQVTGGRLMPEVVRRIIRANFGGFRKCYELGLRQDPELRGSVAVRFIIGEDGAVETAFLSDGTMTNEQVKTCVVGVYRTLSFPAPEGGKVQVRFPIDFDNND
jgi:hypothetical protein